MCCVLALAALLFALPMLRSLREKTLPQPYAGMPTVGFIYAGMMASSGAVSLFQEAIQAVADISLAPQRWKRCTAA